jgi:hypothetical protein
MICSSFHADLDRVDAIWVKRQVFPMSFVGNAAVGTTARVPRESSRVPRSDSRSAMIREARDCDSSHLRAAPEKPPNRATRL